LYQLFVGEIGISRREFLYDIRFWEARRIIRGYRRRDRLKHQLLAECAYAAIYAMRDPRGKKPQDLFPEIFKEEDEHNEPEVSEEVVSKLQAEMAAINASIQKGETS